MYARKRRQNIGKCGCECEEHKNESRHALDSVSSTLAAGGGESDGCPCPLARPCRTTAVSPSELAACRGEAPRYAAAPSGGIAHEDRDFARAIGAEGVQPAAGTA